MPEKLYNSPGMNSQHGSQNDADWNHVVNVVESSSKSKCWTDSFNIGLTHDRTLSSGLSNAPSQRGGGGALLDIPNRTFYRKLLVFEEREANLYFWLRVMH